MRHSLSKDTAFNGETAPSHTFLCSDPQCLPLAIPESCAQNMGLRLLENHSFRLLVISQDIVGLQYVAQHLRCWKCVEDRRGWKICKFSLFITIDRRLNPTRVKFAYLTSRFSNFYSHPLLP